ncbi:PAS domain S-box protein [Actinoplanes sp. HUAS TT8]|uniref:PAS domain S-box protein n=1 Tax=Actinoplanes sp. HUAS TT8 TaxID=3447453 RepID=UPI003F522B49
MSVGFRARLEGQPLELLAHAFDRSPVPKLVLSLAPDDYGTFTAVNAAFCELVGYPAEQLIGKSAMMLLDEDRVEPVAALFEAMTRGECDVMAMERILIRRDGSRVWIVSQNLMVTDRDGHQFLFAEIVESSGRPALADSEARFRTLVDSSPIGMAVLGTDGAWVRANPAVSAMLGYTGTELAALTLRDVTHPDDRDACVAMLHDMANGVTPSFQGDFRYVGKNGHPFWCRLTVSPLASESGAPLQLLAQLADVSTERRNQERLVVAEQTTAREAERLRTTIAVQREIGAMVADRDALVALIADRALQVLPSGTAASVHLLDVAAGLLRPAAAVGMDLPDVPVTDSLAGVAVTSGGTVRCDDTTGDPRVNPAIARATGMGSLIIAPLRAPGSGTFGVLMVGSGRAGAFDDGDEQQLTLLADAVGNALRHAEDAAIRQDLLSRTTAAVEALEREQAATLAAMARLERSERQFAEVADNSPIARIVLGLRDDDRGRIVLSNPAFCRLFGYRDAEAVGMHFETLIGDGPSEELERNLTIMANGERTRGQREIMLRRQDGTPLTVAAHTSVIFDEHGPATAVVQLRDITAERAAEEATEREVRRLRGTLAVQREVTEAATDRAATVRVVAARAVDLFPAADGAAVELVEDDQLVYVATAGTLTPFNGTRLPRSGSLSGIALATDSPAHCADTATDERVNRAKCEELGIGSMLVAPLHADKKVIGVLKVSAASAYAFDDTDEQQLALLADSLSAALRHADDATRNAAALRELEISEQRFRLTFDNSPLGLTLCSLRDEDFGRYLQANPAMTAITGWSQEELTAMRFADLTHPDEVASTREFARRLIDREIDTLTTERRYRHKDGHTIWVSVRVAVVTDERNRARYVVNQVEDVTAAREADAQLRRTARLFELIPAAVIVRDLDGNIRWWNDGATQLYGWPLSAARGKSSHRLLHTTFPQGGSRAEQERALQDDGHWNGQLDHITADGRTVNVLSRQVLHSLDPDNAQVLEVNADQTAARAAEVALAESAERLRAQFSNTAVAQVISALDGTMISANPAYGAMLGRPVEELAGMSTRELTHPDDRVAGQQRIAGLFAGDGDSYTTESRLRHADGHWVPVEATVSMVRDADGNPKLLVGVITDITSRRAAEQARDAATAALEERNTELEAANQLKLDIIGMLGHEIGNPLTSIRGNAEILTDDWAALSDERRGRAIDAIARQAGTLDEIVQEVLAMVTIESGKIRADRRRLDLREEIDRALWAADAAAVPVSGPDARALFHPGHLQQILVNLLSNARKYGGGATAVRVSVTSSLVEVAVEDDGPGVPEEFRNRLFERLARADRDATSVKGTGLGLYIVRGLAQANHGDIRYEPNPSGGSRFVISLESPAPDRE